MTPKATFRGRGTWFPEKTGIVRMRPLALTITNTQTEMDWVAVIAQPTIWGICSMTERVNSIMVRTIQGSITTMSESTAKALGTNDSVCSWIDVTAWKTLTPRPITRAVIRIGEANVTELRISDLMISTAVSGFMNWVGK